MSKENRKRAADRIKNRSKEQFAGKTWKVINGKRVWMEK